MLARAARRRHALQYVERTAEKLQLQWLCPALYHVSTPNNQRRISTTTCSRPSPYRARGPAFTSTKTRHLASATHIDSFDYHDEYLPFSYERETPAVIIPYNRPTILSAPHDLLIFDQTTASALRPSSFRNIDIRGDAVEIENNLDACLQVHNWTRAFAILNQLSRLYAGNVRRQCQIYNKVLESMVLDLIWNRNMQNQDKIAKWIEVDMARAGVEPDVQTYALKIKMALATLSGSRRDNTVRRYWETAKKYSTQIQPEIANMRKIFSDNDLGIISEIYPMEVDNPLGLDVDQDFQEEAVSESSGRTGGNLIVREAKQKGLGLISLRQALASFEELDRIVPEPQEVVEQAHLRQSRLEQDSLQSAMDRWKQEHEKRMKMGVSGNIQHGKIGALTWHWHELLTKKIEEEVRLVEKAEVSLKHSADERLRCHYGPFLKLIDPQHLAATSIISVVNTMTRTGVASTMKLARLVTEVGKAVEQEIAAQRKKSQKSLKKAKNGRLDQDSLPSDQSVAGTMLYTSTFSQHTHWSTVTAGRVGAILCELLFDVARMNTSKEDPVTGKTTVLAEPVFHRQLSYVHGRRVTNIIVHSAFNELVSKQPPADLIAKQLPMVSKPKPWIGYTDGGYLQSIQPVLRVKNADIAQRDYAKAAAERGDLEQVFAGLDVLGSTGWKINKDVFNVMLEAWNSGEAVANLSPADKIFPDIEKPAEDASTTDKWKYYNKLRVIENEKGGLHSKRCFQNFQMEIAKSYLDETFYLPHNVDFRGRAYPIPPYLNQMGADNARGLLIFATGRELGLDGLRWIQIHLANVFGYDKASLADRAQFSLDNIDDIRDSVQNPFTGKRWWLRAEDPWQCLAACYELVNALDSPDPTKYVSHLPIHQDGTCNGLQHYAALGGDIAGARQVNLEPGDKPADVYTGVAELVKAEVKHDAEQGLEIAKALEGRITRKIVKQTVMTNVYGVTFTGAMRQVRKQVDDLLPDLNQSDQAAQAAAYIARKIFKGLGTLFEGAHEIQYWLGDCASRICHSISPTQLEQLEMKEFGDVKVSEKSSSSTPRKKKKSEKKIDAADFRSTIVWTTPLKLPVVQPYRINTTQTVKTSIQGIMLAQPSVADAVDPRKQLQGFPPNFVHSLDATHMMLSALRARELGLTFSAVHDSFWTHASDVNTLNIVLRDAFIRMHSEDIMARLAAEFRARYRGHWYLAKIGYHNIVARKIQEYRSSTRGNTRDKSQQRYIEIVREIQRMRLLASEDPAKRAEGEAMVTAAAIFETYDGRKYLPDKVSLGQTAIGEVSEADPLSVEAALHADADADVDMEHTLDPLLEAEAATAKDIEVNKSSKSSKDAKDTGSEWLWLPLSFRDVPKKGEFNVEKLRESTYFFS